MSLYATSGRVDWSHVSSGNATETRKRKIQSRSTITHEIFKTMQTLTSDPELLPVLQEAYYNRFPRGFSFDGNIITYRRGTRDYKQELSMDNIHESLTNFRHFLRINQGIYTSQDQSDRLIREASIVQEQGNCTWTSFNKADRDILIINFVDRVGLELSLSSREKTQLNNLINFGIMFRHLNKDNIIISNGIIISLPLVQWDQSMRLFRFDQSGGAIRVLGTPKISTTIPRHEKDLYPTILKRWENYQKSLPPLPSKPQIVPFEGNGTDAAFFSETGTDYSTDIQTCD